MARSPYVLSIRKACAPAVGTLIGWWWWYSKYATLPKFQIDVSWLVKIQFDRRIDVGPYTSIFITYTYFIVKKHFNISIEPVRSRGGSLVYNKFKLKFHDLFGVADWILVYCTRSRRFNPRTVQTFVSMNMSICIGSGCFQLKIMYVFTKKKYLFISTNK
jgi:hypothetical protein